jgi:hypothetical protein
MCILIKHDMSIGWSNESQTEFKCTQPEYTNSYLLECQIMITDVAIGAQKVAT